MAAQRAAGLALALTGILSAFPPQVAAAQLASALKSQPLTILVGQPPGNRLDRYARMIARHMGRHLPGAGKVVVHNMPAWAGMAAAGHIHERAPKTGLQIATLPRDIAFRKLLNPDEIPFDPRQFEWLGSPAADVPLVILADTDKLVTLADLKSRPIVWAANAPGSDTATLTRLMSALFGPLHRIEHGYQGIRGALVAVAGKQAGGIAGVDWDEWHRTRPALDQKRQLTIAARLGSQMRPGLEHVPRLRDLARHSADKEQIDMLAAPYAMANAYIAPPGLAVADALLLRSALMATLADTAFRADAARGGLPVAPLSVDELKTILANAYNAPPAVHQRLKDALAATNRTRD